MKRKVNAVHVITLKSESGDDYGPFVFNRQPTDKELEKFLRFYCEQEFVEPDSHDEDEGCGDQSGPGIFGSCLHMQMNCEIEITELK